MKGKEMRLTLVIPSLSSGGAERVVSILSNYWASKGWSITILTFGDSSEGSFYDLDYRISHVPLGLAKSSHVLNKLKRLAKLRKNICESNPDAIISFLDATNVITLLVTRGLNIPVLITEHNNPSHHTSGEIWAQLRPWVYPLGDSLIAPSQGILNYFSPWLSTKTCLIHNPVILPFLEQQNEAREIGKNPSLIAVGSLSDQKGFDLLLQAFAQLKDIHPQWTLNIFGKGELLSELECLRDSLELSNRVYFPGVVKNIYDVMKKADIFVLSSRYEGFGMVLAEAMACGLAVISTDCPSGPGEIIRDGIDGILVPNEDVEGLAKAMGSLMSDENERQRLGKAAVEVTERFSLEKVMETWENLLYTVLEEKT